MNQPVQYVNPNKLFPATYFSHAALVPPGTSLLLIGGQNAVDVSGAIIGKGDMKRQAQQIIDNMQTLLEKSDCSFHDIIKWSVYVVEGQDPQPAYELFARLMAERKEQPLITMIYVPRLALKDALLEVEAIAICNAHP